MFCVCISTHTTYIYQKDICTMHTYLDLDRWECFQNRQRYPHSIGDHTQHRCGRQSTQCQQHSRRYRQGGNQRCTKVGYKHRYNSSIKSTSFVLSDHRPPQLRKNSQGPLSAHTHKIVDYSLISIQL